MTAPQFKSKLEVNVWNSLKKAYPHVEYEPDKIPFIQPAKDRVYIPDFKIGDVYIEAKGKLDIDTRQKMLWFRECNPDVQVLILFQNSSNKIRKGSKTTYADWAEKNGFPWLDFRRNWLNDYKQLQQKR
jgi:predicted nuclease of restriction endonuclease-like RecB superfamily